MASVQQKRQRLSGAAIDRSSPLVFTYNGRTMTGYAGDTVQSALIANDVKVVGRSFKYHRPRGFYGVGLEDPNSMVAIRDGYGYEPAIRAGQVLLSQGLEVRSITGYPSSKLDLGAAAQLFSSILGAGFYYKTMMWPNWSLFEPLIRRATGFGRLREEGKARRNEHCHATADVLIIGAGPAGLAAALALQDSELEVVVAELDPQVGGSLKWEDVTIDGKAGSAWAQDSLVRLQVDRRVRVLTSTTVVAAYENNVFTLVQALRDDKGVRSERHWKLYARHVVFATGLIERPLLFADNDRPGIMLASAVRRLIGEYGVAPCDRLVVYTNNDSGYLSAISASRAGIDVAALVDTRPRDCALHVEETERLGIQHIFSAEISGTKGRPVLDSVTVCSSSGTRMIRCDGLAVAGGWTPSIHLACHRGGRPVYDEEKSVFVVPVLPAGWHAAGGVAGPASLQHALEQGTDAAMRILGERGNATAHALPYVAEARNYGGVRPQWRPRTGPSDKIWVDFQNDVKVSDIEIAARENYVSVEHLKRYTTLGMGTDQGRTSNVNGLAVMAGLTGSAVGEIGVTTFRPMFSSVRLSTIAGHREGDLYQPRRYLPADDLHRRHDAVFDDFGWERPDWYRCNGDDREKAVCAEMFAVRNEVGIFDGSSLGKIEISGPDSGKFLARFYVSDMTTLKPGAVRYSVMLREDGVIFDDGVVACLGSNYFLASPSSGNADAVAAWFERWRQVEWPNMRVSVCAVTSNWATMALAGPKSRRLLERLGLDFDVGREAFAHMQIRQGRWAGISVRVARVSFTGELQYEVSVPARFAAALLDELLKPSEGLLPKPVGMEAWLRLRLEKGYLHIGSDTNGRTTPFDIGMGSAVARRRDDFIGKRSLALSFAHHKDREQLVGVVEVDGKIEAGARVLAPGFSCPPCPTEGYVTSACQSPNAGGTIGLALVERGFERREEEISLYSMGKVVRARIVAPVFYDPENERVRM